jgi:hypothetical protein
MPLLNIYAVIGNKKTIQIALCFLSSEKVESYKWAIEAFRELIGKNSISKPTTLVTNRELALIICLNTFFPESTYVLCL